MIKGMTGFGSALISSSKFKGSVEIRSQNHRYLDIVYYFPPGFSSFEDKVRQILEKELERGRVSVAFKILQRSSQKLFFNQEAAKEYFKYAKILQKEYGLENNLRLSDLLRMPGVVEAKEALCDPDEMWPLLEKCLRQSLSSLVFMRKREGKSLATDISQLLKRMLLQIKIIQSRIKVLLNERKKTLSLEEFSSFQKGIDVNEELTRLTHYIQEFKSLLSVSASIGKKMDFVAQEMQRETNTIGAKLQDKIVSSAAIALKSKIEKLREHAQNIE